MTADGGRFMMYPPPLRALLNTLGAEFAALPSVRSVLLAGSVARGEASVLVDQGGRLSMLGDIELLVVADDTLSPACIEETIGRAAADWRPSFAVCPLIDVSVVTTRRLTRLQRKLFVFETKSAGACLGGQDLHERLPDVPLDRLDFSELNELRLHRLEALLNVFGGSDAIRTEAQAQRAWYAVARNTLDVATWLLPYAGVLLPTYRERADYVAAHPELPFINCLPAGFVQRLRTYTHWKLHPSEIPCRGSPPLATCLDDFEAAERWVAPRFGAPTLRRYGRRRRFLRATRVAARAVRRRETSLRHALAWVVPNTFTDRARLATTLLRWSAESEQVGAEDIARAERLLRRVRLESLSPGERDPAWLRDALLTAWDVHWSAPA